MDLETKSQIQHHKGQKLNNINDIYYKTLIMHLGAGLLASQTSDRKYIDTPGLKKEEHFTNDVFKYSDEIMKRFDFLDKKENKK